MSTDTRRRLIDAATTSVRMRGYHAVSFRDLADDLGIRSASVHYHFARKEDLGLALVEAYSAAFFDALDARERGARTTAARLRAFRDVYRDALHASEHHCLCGMLGAEARGLPAELAAAVNAFFEANVARAADALGGQGRAARARQFVATLQGAMMLAGSLGDPTVFDDATDALLKDAATW